MPIRQADKPYLKAIPDEKADKLHFVMDQAGFDLFERLISRAVPPNADSSLNFNSIKEYVSGAFLAGAVQMGWRAKRAK